MTFREFKPEELLGRLNETEQRNAPKALFVAGDTSILDRGGRVAIVGSRKASDEALSRARKLAGLVVKNGAVVVSGLAAGIDTAALQSAIKHGGNDDTFNLRTSNRSRYGPDGAYVDIGFRYTRRL